MLIAGTPLSLFGGAIEMLIEITDKVRSLLSKSYIKDILILPEMSNQEYDQMKYVVEYLGGHWREKLHGFVFNESKEVMQAKLAEVQRHETIPLDKEAIFQIRNQFYPTPDWLAQEMVLRAGIDNQSLTG